MPPLRQPLPVDLKLIRRVIQRRLSYLDRYALLELAAVVRDAGRRGLDGSMVEAGCALGGSAITMARSKRRETALAVHDVFGMIPPPTEEDGADIHQRYQEITAGRSSGLGGDRYYGYEPDLRARVQRNIEGFGLSLENDHITLVQGLFEHTMIGDQPICVAHIDCDWYQSVLTCLKRLWPRLVTGGTLVIDDYYHWSGCRRAVDSYFAGQPSGSFHFEEQSRLHVIRRRFTSEGRGPSS